MQQGRGKPHYLGHRQRLRKRFQETPKTIADYELIELLLHFTNPRCDTKPQAKELLSAFKKLGELIYTDSSKIRSIKGVGEKTALLFKLIAEMLERVMYENLRSEIEKGISLNSTEKVASYYRTQMQYLDIEHFCALFLDTKGHLISTQTLQTGTIDKAVVYPREVLRKALDLNSKAVILVHNHPSGCTNPSKADIDITKLLSDALNQVDIKLLDHIIVARSGHFSLKAHEFF